jgi:subtilase family serine protease
MLYRHHRLLPLLVVTLSICAPNFLSAQGKEPVRPLLDVLGSGKNSVVGLTPAQIKRAYGFDQIKNQGERQTIAIVDPFDHPNIYFPLPPSGFPKSDLTTFDQQFGLPDPDCGAGHGCFQKVLAPLSKVCLTNPGTADPNYSAWALEIALDVEWAHAIAPKANIVLVEVPDAELDCLLEGVDLAVNSGASVVSMSWGVAESQNETGAQDSHFQFVRPGVTFFAGAGDSGHGTVYPAASPFVMSVGATTLHVDKAGKYSNEKAWPGTGGGTSLFEQEPQYQSDYGIPNDPPPGMRGTPDVAYDGDPNTGVAVFDSVPFGGDTGWSQIGGTSAGVPQWSALVAIANSLRAEDNKPALAIIGIRKGKQVFLPFLYSAVQASNGEMTFHDISNGKDGNCGQQCRARPGYDYLTGLGTPRADLLIPALSSLLQ